MMRLLSKVLASLVLIVLVVVGLFSLLMYAMCGSDEKSRFPSPDGRHDAVVYLHDCGATTGYTTEVAIVRSRARVPHGHGNVGSSEWVGRVQALWQGPDSLTILYDDRLELLGKERQVQGIRIGYRPVNGSGLQGIFNLHGQVRDARGGAISGALVAVYGQEFPDSGLRTDTDSAGSFSIFSTATFDFTARATFSKDGYRPATTLIPNPFTPHRMVVVLQSSDAGIASRVKLDSIP
jgi:hypothetical protein